MLRRRFIQTTASIATYCMLPNLEDSNKVKLLRKGDTVAVITPGSHVVPDKLKSVVARIQSLGYKVKLGKYTDRLYGYNAGKDHERIADIHWAFSDPEVKAVWCGRGGYGCTRLLPYLDYKLLSKHPKPLIGL